MLKRKLTKPELTIIFPDIHFAHGVNGIKPMDRHDPVALSIAFQLVRDLKPKRHIQLGDLYHGGYLSHWNAAKDMQGRVVGLNGKALDMCLDDDHSLINRYFDKLQEAVPKGCELIQLEGNHEEILRGIPYKNSERGKSKTQYDPVLAWRLRERGIKWIPYQKYDNEPNYYKLGPHLVIEHGHYASTNHIAKHFQEHLTNCIYGHLHTIEEKCFKHPREHISVKSIGCLCTREASYHRGRNNAWGQAICLVWMLPSGEFYDHVVRIIDGKTVYDGKVYYGKEESWMK